MSAPILTGAAIPAFNGSIEVDITSVDLPGSAEFGKCMIINLYFASSCKTRFERYVLLIYDFILSLPVPNCLLQFAQIPCHLVYTGKDYVFHIQNPSSRIFTVTFQPKQANSTKHFILLSEGPESFRLQILGARFIGEAATFFRVQEGLTNTIATVNIRDNDCEFRLSA